MSSNLAYWMMIGFALTALSSLLALLRFGGMMGPRLPRRQRRERKQLIAEPITESRQRERHWLLGIDGEVTGRVFHLGMRTATIGRKESNHVQLCDLHTSRVHCQLTPINKGILLTDMRSQNGVLLNDKMTRSGVLKDGDILQISGAKFLYRAEGNYGICEIANEKMTGPEMHKPTLCRTA